MLFLLFRMYFPNIITNIYSHSKSDDLNSHSLQINQRSIALTSYINLAPTTQKEEQTTTSQTTTSKPSPLPSEVDFEAPFSSDYVHTTYPMDCSPWKWIVNYTNLTLLFNLSSFRIKDLADYMAQN